MLLIDWFSLIFISAFAIAGIFNGFAKELFSTASWLISILAAWYFGPLLFPFIDYYFNNPDIKPIVSFVCLFLILFILIRILGSITSKFLNILGLRFIDKSAGLIFGAVKATAILVTFYMLFFSNLEGQSWWRESLSRENTIKIAEIMEPLLKDWKSQAEILLNKEHVTLPPSL